MSSAEEDKFLDDLFSSSSSEEELEEEDPPVNPEEHAARMTEIRETFYGSLPAEPPGEADRLVFYLFYAVQFVLLYFKYDGYVNPINVALDSDQDIYEKMYFEHTREAYHRVFEPWIKQIGDDVYNLVFDKLEDFLKEDRKNHVLVYWMEQMELYKEMHSRRLKTNPGIGRTKQDVIAPTYNAITTEMYDSENPDHKSWKMLILNPLPSDYDYRAIDPAEGDSNYRTNIEIEKLKNNYPIPEPFSIVVTPEWEKIFRIVHSALHFADYFHSYTVGSITNDEWDTISTMYWPEAWKTIVGEEFAHVPIEKFSREKKKVPPLVSKTAELRDLLKELILFK